MPNLKIKKLNSEAILPTRANPDDCGLDIYALEGAVIEPFQGKVISTGIAGEFIRGYVGMLTDRSSMAKKGFKVAGGIIDPGYTGELLVVLRNLTTQTITIEKGNRIAQLLIIPVETPRVEEVIELSDSVRAERGFGSSGS